MKSKFIKSTIILIIGGFITKILGMVIKIALTRVISTKGIGLYMLILPTFNLFITLCTLGLPTAISKLVSENKRRSKKIVLSIVPVVIIFNFMLMILLFFVSPFISKYLLKNTLTFYPLICISFTLPFICISSIIKGYFFGKERMFPYTLSNIIEQLVRLFLTIFYIPNLLKYSLTITICGVVLINIISEFISILTLLLFLPKKEVIYKKDFSFDKNIIKDMLNISIPTTTTRLIGSLSYFLEPIILTFCLIKLGYNNNYITLEYGIINGYVYPLLLLPSFFTMAISNALLPVVSKNYVRQNYSYINKKVKQAIIFSLLIGIPCTFVFIFVPNILLNFIYNTNLGINYIKVIAPFFLLHYIQSPLTIVLQAIDKASCAMRGTFIGCIIKLILLFILTMLNIGMWGLIISSIVNIIYVTLHHVYYVVKYLKR